MDQRYLILVVYPDRDRWWYSCDTEEHKDNIIEKIKEDHTSKIRYEVVKCNTE